MHEYFSAGIRPLGTSRCLAVSLWALPVLVWTAKCPWGFECRGFLAGSDSLPRASRLLRPVQSLGQSRTLVPEQQGWRLAFGTKGGLQKDCRRPLKLRYVTEETWEAKS